MKKLLLLVFAVTMITGCSNFSKPCMYTIGEKYTIGDCEYVFGGQTFTHAGDCKNCKNNKKEE